MTEQSYYNRKCKCGCGGFIEVKRHHKYSGIPIYIHGHNESQIMEYIGD